MAAPIRKVKLPQKLKNVGRSMGYTVVDTLAQYNPTLVSLKQQSKGSMNYVRNAFKDMKTESRSYLHSTGDNIRAGFNDARDDLRTGDYYNQERTNARLLNGYDNDEDWGDGQAPRANQVASSENNSKTIINSIVGSNKATIEAMGQYQSRSTEYIVRSNTRSSKAIYNLTSHGFNQISNILLDTNRKLDGVLTMAEPLSMHVTNSAVFYTRTSQTLDTMNANLQKLVDRTEFMDPNYKRRRRYDPRSGANFMNGKDFDLRGYLDMVVHNLGEETATLKAALGLDQQKNQVNIRGGLVSQIASSALDSIIPKYTKQAMQEFNDSLANTLKAFLYKGGNQLRGSNNPLANFLGSVFFPSSDFKTKPGTARYNKGPIQWDGEAKKALTEVIPTYLAKIYAAVGGEEKYFDYATGRYVTKRQVAQREQYEEVQHAYRAAGNLRTVSHKRAGDNKKIKAELDQYFYNAFLDPNGDFASLVSNKNNKEFMDRYGLSPESMAILLQIISESKTGKAGYKSKGKNLFSSFVANNFGENARRSQHISQRETKVIDRANILNNGFDEEIKHYNSSMNGYMANIYQMVGNIYAAMITKGRGKRSKKGKVQNIFDVRSQSITGSVYDSDYGPISNDDIPKYYGWTDDEIIEYEARKARELNYEYNFKNSTLGVIKDAKVKAGVIDADTEISDDIKRKLKSELSTDDPEKAKSRLRKGANRAKGLLEKLETPFDCVTLAINKLTDGMNTLFWGDGQRVGLLDRIGESFDNLYDKLRDKLSDKLSKLFGDKVKTSFKEKASNLWAATKNEAKSIGKKALNKFEYAKEQMAQINAIRNQMDHLDDDYNTDIYGEKIIDAHAYGTRQIQRTGLAVLSKGEMVIPSELNPYYHGITNKAQQVRDENSIRNRFLGMYADGNMHYEGEVVAGKTTKGDDVYYIYRKNKKGRLVKRRIKKADYLKRKAVQDAVAGAKDLGMSTAEAGKEAINNISKSDTASFFASGIDSLFHGAKDFFQEALFGDKKQQEKEKKQINKTIAERMKEAYGEFDNAKGAMVIGAGAGVGVSILTSALVGPVAGAAIGAGVGFLAKSQKAQDFLFGKGDPNSDEYEQGLLKGFGKFAKQNAGAFKGAGEGAGAGLLAGSFLGSPVLGAALGGITGFVLKSNAAQRFLLGDEITDEKGNRIGRQGGFISKAVQDNIKKNFPNMSAGLLAGMALVPGGIVTKILVGSALGYVSTTDEFHKFMFGDKESGQLGLAGTIREKIIGNLNDILHNMGNQIKGIFNKLNKKIGDLVDSFKNRIKKVFDETVKNHPLLNKVAGTIAKYNPVALVGAGLDKANSGLKKHNLKKGYGVYDRKLGRNMTAAERIKYRKDNELKDGNYGTFDRELAGINSVEELDDLESQIQSLNNRSRTYNAEMSGIFNGNNGIGARLLRVGIKPKDITKLIKAIRKGDEDAIDNILASYPDNVRDQADKIVGEGSTSVKTAFANLAGDQAKLESLSKYGINAGTDLTTVLDSIKNERETKFKNPEKLQEMKEEDEVDKSYNLIGMLHHIDVIKSQEAGTTPYKLRGKYKNVVKNDIKNATATLAGGFDPATSAFNDADKVNDVLDRATRKQDAELRAKHGDLITTGEADENGIITKIDAWGNPVQYTRNQQGELVKMTNDSDTKKSEKIMNQFLDSVNSIPVLGGAITGIGGLLGTLKSKLVGDEENNTKGLFDTITDFFNGDGNSSISKILGVALPAAVIAGFKGYLDPLIKNLGDVFFRGNDTTSVLDNNTSTNVTLDDGTVSQVQTDSNGNLVTDDNGNYVLADGSTVSSDGVKLQSVGSNDSFSSRLKKNLANSAIMKGSKIAGKFLGNATDRFVSTKAGKIIQNLGGGSLGEWAVGSLGKKAGKVANKAKSIASGVKGFFTKNAASTVSAAGEAVEDVAAKATTKAGEEVASKGLLTVIKDGIADAVKNIPAILKKIPVIKNTKAVEKCEKWVEAFCNFMDEKVAKIAGGKLSKIAAGLSNALLVLKIAYIAGKGINAYGNAGSILGITDEPTTTQRLIAVLVEVINCLIPVIGDIIPSKALVSFFIDKIAPIIGWDMSGIKAQREAATKEVEEYNKKNGTEYSIQEYNELGIEYNESTGEYEQGKARAGIFTRAKNGVKSWWSNLTKKDKTTTQSTSTSGSGSGLSGGSSFISQRDPSIASRAFAGSTFGEKGCGPAVAAMAANANGKQLSINNAINASAGYQNANGVSADYFNKVLGSRGISTTPVTGANNMFQVLSGSGNMILLGQDASNTSKANSPFGPGNHYVLAKGLDGNGNVIVDDPEASRGNKVYNKSILNHVKLGLATGSGSMLRRNIIRFISGGSSGVRDDSTTQQVWAYLTTKLGMSEAAAAGVMGNMQQESGCNPNVNQKKGSAFGICQWDGGRKTALMKKPNYQTLSVQLDYLASELPSQPWKKSGTINDKDGKTYKYETMTYDQFKALKDIAVATVKFEAAFERAGKPHLANRIKYAKQYYELFTGKTISYDESLSSVVVDSTDGTTSIDSSTTSSSDSSSGSTDVLSSVSSLFSRMFGFLTGDTGEDEGDEASDENGNTDSSSGSDSTGSTAGTSSDPSAYNFNGTDPVSYMKSKLGTLKYSMKGARDPDKGSSDCSSTVRWAVKKATGVDIGGSTPDQYDSKNLTDVWYGNGKYPSTLPENMKPNDIIFFSRPNSDFSKGRKDRVGHVGIYEGDGKYIHHGGGKDGKTLGPTESTLKAGDKGKIIKISRLKSQSAAGSGIPSYTDLISGGSSGVLLNSRVGSRNYGNNRLMFGASGGASYVSSSDMNSDVTSMLNEVKTTAKSQANNGAISAELVSKLLESIANLLGSVANNTAPIEKIYQVLSEHMYSGGSSSPQNYTTTASSSTRTKGVSNSSTVSRSGEVDSNLKALAGVLAELAKG